MNNDLKNIYFVRKSSQVEWQDVAKLFDGLRILKVDGFDEKGKAINIYNAQWVDSQDEDIQFTKFDEHNNPIVVRENIDLEITFIVGTRYSTNAIDVRTQHDRFISYMMDSDVYIKSAYVDKEVRCVALDTYKPTTTKLHRGVNSYIIGTLKMHTLTIPNVSQIVVVGDLYIGFGASSITSESDITSLANVQHYNVSDAAGTYTITCPSTSYLWICTKETIDGVVSNGFEVPIQGAITIGEYRCYRSSNSIIAHTMTFTIMTS